MSYFRKIYIATIFVLMGYSGNGVAIDNYYLFNQAMNAARSGASDEAVKFYEEYIYSHPLGLDSARAGSIKNKQYYLRNLLIAYDNLIAIHSQNGDKHAVSKLISDVEGMYRSGRLGSKNSYKTAMILQEQGLSEEAAEIFLWIVQDQRANPLPQNNKVALRSYKKLFNYYQTKGDSGSINSLSLALTIDFPSTFCDSNDRYMLAGMLERYGNNSYNSIRLLDGIVDDYMQTQDRRDLNAALRSISKLAKIYQKNGDEIAFGSLVEKISDSSAFENLPLASEYKLGSSLLNYGRAKKGAEILDKVVTRYPYSLEARKALFILGRNSLAEERWNDAIRYYSAYVKHFPDAGFFTLKAYSRLLDAHFSRDGNTDFLQSELETFAEIISDMSEYEHVLNLSRDLKWKGKDELADSTFDLALAKARAHINENAGSYEELRSRWILEKYAYALERNDIVDENGRKLLALSARLLKQQTNNAEKKKIRYLRGQTHLWLAKLAQDNQSLAELESQLKAFIEENPADPDIDYAWYQLGKTHQDVGDHVAAIQSFQKVRKGVWKEKADEHLLGWEKR